jgi:hypothetical protein
VTENQLEYRLCTFVLLAICQTVLKHQSLCMFSVAFQLVYLSLQFHLGADCCDVLM